MNFRNGLAKQFPFFFGNSCDQNDLSFLYIERCENLYCESVSRIEDFLKKYNGIADHLLTNRIAKNIVAGFGKN